MSRYRVTFDRISRDHNVAPFVCEARDAQELSEVLYPLVKRRCASREVEVIVDLEAMTAAIIVGGMQSAGSGRVEVL